MSYEVTKYKNIVKELQHKIWSYAELSYEEYQSAALLTNVLEENGYRVERGIYGIPTAFRAVYQSHGCTESSPSIGLLMEYDALDGLSQKADETEVDPRPETTHGHGCGHHLIASGIAGTALVLRDYLDQHPAAGKVVVYGCPAEEAGAGKTFMAREGAFRDIDVALTWHPSCITAAMTGSLLANVMADFSFHGVASHAGAFPQLGRSALDAAELMDVGCNYLREHMEMTDRIHYAILDSGTASPNVVPAQAKVRYLVRSRDNDSVKALFKRVVDIARGAALMTGTTMEYHIVNGLSNVVPSDTLGQLCHDKLVQLGVPDYTEEEKAYVLRFRRAAGEEAADHELGMLPSFHLDQRFKLNHDHPCGDYILPFEPMDVVETGSSDMGDVSQICPLIQLQVACFSQGTPAHSRMEVAQGTSSYALEGALYAGQTLAEMTKELMEHPDLIQKAVEENRRRTGGRPYTCPIPDDVKPAIHKKD